jgi:hypothetical protein
MAATVFSQTDEVVGELGNGLKLVYTTLTQGSGDGVTVITITPLTHVEMFFVGARTIAGGTSGYAYQCVQYGGADLAATYRSGETASGYYNRINVLCPTADAANYSGAVLNIVSLGV